MHHIVKKYSSNNMKQYIFLIIWCIGYDSSNHIIFMCKQFGSSRTYPIAWIINIEFLLSNLDLIIQIQTHLNAAKSIYKWNFGPQILPSFLVPNGLMTSLTAFWFLGIVDKNIMFKVVMQHGIKISLLDDNQAPIWRLSTLKEHPSKIGTKRGWSLRSKGFGWDSMLAC